MTAYADYDYYKNVYHGKAVPSDDFDRAALMATMYIDKITFGRISGNDVDDRIRNACCAAAEVYYSSDAGCSAAAASAAGKSSEKVGDYSVSYSSSYYSESNKNKRLYGAVSLWIPAKFLYRGGVHYGNKPCMHRNSR